jgi:hypothetical protein
MLETFVSYLVLYGLSSNIMIANGSGVLEFQREKMYRKFRYLNALLLILGIAITGFVHYFLEAYVYEKFDIQFVGFTVVILIAGLYGFAVSAIWKKASHFGYYLYKNSYSYAFDLVYTVSVILMLQVDTSILNFALQLVAVALVVLVMNVIVGFFVRSMNRGYMNTNFRNISSRLFLLAFISILIYYSGLLVL